MTEPKPMTPERLRAQAEILAGVAKRFRCGGAYKWIEFAEMHTCDAAMIMEESTRKLMLAGAEIERCWQEHKKQTDWYAELMFKDKGLEEENARLKEEVEGLEASCDIHASLNRRTAEALGKPRTGEGSSWSDIPEWVEKLKAEVAEWKNNFNRAESWRVKIAKENEQLKVVLEEKIYPDECE